MQSQHARQSKKLNRNHWHVIGFHNFYIASPGINCMQLRWRRKQKALKCLLAKNLFKE